MFQGVLERVSGATAKRPTSRTRIAQNAARWRERVRSPTMKTTRTQRLERRSGSCHHATLERRVHVMADSQSITDRFVEYAVVLLAVAFLFTCA